MYEPTTQLTCPHGQHQPTPLSFWTETHLPFHFCSYKECRSSFWAMHILCAGPSIGQSFIQAQWLKTGALGSNCLFPCTLNNSGHSQIFAILPDR